MDLDEERRQLHSGDQVRRYVAREMPADEVRAFEIELLGSEDLQDAVEAELLLRETAPLLVQAQAQPRLQEPGVAWKFAACTVVALGVGFGAGRYSGGALSAAEGSWSLVQLTEVRGAAPKAFAIPRDQPFLVRVLTADEGRHQLHLYDPNGAEVRRWGGLQPAEDGFLTVLLPALPAHAQPYRLTVDGGGMDQAFALQTGG